MTAAIVAFLLAVNPAAAARAFTRDRRPDRPVPITIGWAVAMAVLAALAAASGPMLDALDLSDGTFRLGAGVVVGAVGLRWLVFGAPDGVPEPDTSGALAGFIAFPVLLTPGAAVLAVSVSAGDGFATAAAGAAAGTAVGALTVLLRRRLPQSVLAALVRLLGAGAVVIGIGVAVDGVQTM